MKQAYILISLIIISFTAYSQEISQDTIYTMETFRAPLIVNGQSVETNAKKSLNFDIYHRFGPISNTFGGLDQQVNIRWGFSYGLTDDYTIGFGRSKYNGTWDFYGKGKFLKQSSGGKNMPFSLTVYSSAVVKTVDKIGNSENNGNGSGGSGSGSGGGGKGNGGGMGGNGQGGDSLNMNNTNDYNYAWNTQFILARKFNEKFSAQLAPTVTYLFKNDNSTDNLQFGMGTGIRYALNWRWALLGEYYLDFANVNDEIDIQDAWGVGVEIKTALHTFNITLGSSQILNEDAFTRTIMRKSNQDDSSDLHLGFNIIIRNYF